MDRPTRPMTSRPRGVCIYFTKPGGCLNGSSCKFLHGEGQLLSPYDQSKVCKFYAAGFCKRGDQCWFKHDLPQQSLNSSSTTTTTNTNDANDDNDDLEEVCCICQEKPITYGLLADCSHICCLTCLRDWRDPDGKSQDIIESGNTKKCPYCRTPSPFITPSSIFYPNGHPRKAEIIEQYKASMARIPCRYFQRSSPTRRFCPFGRDCFYQHKESDGRDFVFPHGADYYLRRLRTRTDQRHPNLASLFSSFLPDGSGPNDMLRTLTDLRERLVSLSLLPSAANFPEASENYVTRIVDDVLTTLEDALLSSAGEDEGPPTSPPPAPSATNTRSPYSPLPLTRSFLDSVTGNQTRMYQSSAWASHFPDSDEDEETEDEESHEEHQDMSAVEDILQEEDDMPGLLSVSPSTSACGDDDEGYRSSDLEPTSAFSNESETASTSTVSSARSTLRPFVPEPELPLIITVDSDVSEFPSGATSLASSIMLQRPPTRSSSSPSISTSPFINPQSLLHQAASSAPTTPPYVTSPSMSTIPLVTTREPIDISTDEIIPTSPKHSVDLSPSTPTPTVKDLRRVKSHCLGNTHDGSSNLRSSQSFVTDGRGRVVATDDGSISGALQYWNFEPSSETPPEQSICQEENVTSTEHSSS